MDFRNPPKSPSGIPLTEAHPREGSETIKVTHDWCDPTTWYQQSARVTGETLSTEDDLTFSSANTNWIDMQHGKIYNEDTISADYLPVVKIDGVAATMRAPFADTGGDYQINYAAGTVTFFSSQAGKTITADYSRENGSRFTVTPASGKILNVEESEVQFSKDVVLNDTIIFQAYAYDPEDPPNKIPAGNPDKFKTMMDYIDEARGTYPEIPAVGGTKRGMANAHLVFPFKYQVIRQLKSSYGVELRLWLENDTPHGGERATATFYCTSQDEES